MIWVDIIGNFFSGLLKHFFGYHGPMESSWNCLVSTIALFFALHVEFVFEIVHTHICKTVVFSISMAFIFIQIAIVSEKVKFWWSFFFLVMILVLEVIVLIFKMMISIFLFRLSVEINHWAFLSMEINNWFVFWFTMEINLWNRFLDSYCLFFLLLSKVAFNSVLGL